MRSHRIAAILAIAFAVATILSMAALFSIGMHGLSMSVHVPTIADAEWNANWLSGALSIEMQQHETIQQWLRLILVFGGITLLVAMINALIGLASHANERRYETALQAVVGASPRQLRAQLRRAALLNAAAGIALGLPVGMAAMFWIRASWQAATPRAAPWILIACGAAVLLAAVAARLASHRFRRPGWMGDAIAPEARSVPGFGAEDLRVLLNTAQLASAVALSIVSLLIWSYASTSTARYATGAVGTRDVYVARAAASESNPRARAARIEALLSRLRGSGGVQSESIASPGALLGIGKIDNIVSDCGPCSRANMYTPLFPLQAQQHVVGEFFFATAGIRVLQGHEFGGAGQEGDAVVVSESFARDAFQGQNPIGKRILAGGFAAGTWHEVIGVVPDIAPRSMTPQAVYFSAAEHPPDVFDVIVKRLPPAAARAGLSFQPLPDMIARANAPKRHFAQMLAWLGVLLGGAAVTGSFTTTLLGVRARRDEFAIRRSVGARRRDILLLLYAQVARITARSAAAGIIISLALARAAEILVPGLPVFDPVPAVLVSACAFCIAGGASLLASRGAAT